LEISEGQAKVNGTVQNSEERQL